MQLLNSIINYIKFLEREYSLYVSIHSLQPPLNSIMHMLGKYNTHYHPYCLYIKNNPELWKKCRVMQTKVLHKYKTDIFYGKCCFGVSEYIIPIVYKEESIGFISVSGFVSDKTALQNKVKKLSDEYNLDYFKLYNASNLLSQNPPDKNFIMDTLLHIADALSIYAATLPEKSLGSNNTNYIYSNALAYIHQHYNQAVTVNSIALFCNCSRSYITKLFKSHGNFCIKSYITNLRIESAKNLLKDSDKSIKEIGFSLGYNDSNYFSNVFFKNTGVYPREYRRIHKSKP